MRIPGVVSVCPLQDQIHPCTGDILPRLLTKPLCCPRSFSEKLPKPPCITETGQTDPTGVTSLHCPQIFPLFVMQPNLKAARAAVLSCMEGKQHLDELFPVAVSSSAMGKAASEGYVPMGPARGRCVPSPPVRHKRCHHHGQPNDFSGRQEKHQPTNKTPLKQVFSPKIIRRHFGQRQKQHLEGDVPSQSLSIALDFFPACN